LLTGKPPYDYPSLNLVLAAVLEERPALPSSRGIQIPGFDAVIDRALARDPRARFRSGAAFVDALTAVLTAAWSAGARAAQTTQAGRPRVAKGPAASWLPRPPFFRGAVALATAALAWLA